MAVQEENTNPLTRRQLQQVFNESLQQFKSVYVFSFKDVRHKILMDVANFPEWRTSQFWFGRNRIIRGALKNWDNPQILRINELAERIKGPVGVLLTNRPENEVINWFSTFSIWDIPQPGHEVNITIQLKKGPLKQFEPEIEPWLRQLGIPTTVDNGSVVLVKDYEVCREGTILTPEQVHILELVGEKISVYTLKALGKWTKQDGYKVLADDDSEAEEAFSDYE